MTRIHIINHFPATLGDRALLRAIVTGIKERMPDCKISVASFLPNHDCPAGVTFVSWLIKPEDLKDALIMGGSSMYVREMLERRLSNILGGRSDSTETSRSLEELKRADVVIVCPGGYFTDKYDSITLLSCQNIVAAKKLQKKVLLYSSSYGPFFYPELQKYFINTIKDLDAICARDTSSLKLLSESGIEGTRIYRLPDIVLTLKPGDKTGKSTQIAEQPKPLVIGVTPVNFSHDLSPERTLYPKYIRAIAGACDLLVERLGASIFLIPLNQFQGLDAVAVNDIFNAMKCKTAATKVAGNISLDEFCGLLFKTDVLLATRYHSMILATVYGIPYASVSYEPKIKEFMKEVGLSEYCIELKEVESEVLYDKVSAILNNRYFFNDYVKNMHSKLHPRAEEAFELLDELARK